MSLGHIISTLLLLTIVGAVIGGATNYIAIKMLFKPAKPIMIGKWRLPFTPGLIPKRHEEIAVELGRLVMKHLITADRLKIKLLEPSFSKQLSQHVQEQISVWLAQEVTIGERLSKWTDTDQLAANIENQMVKWLGNGISHLYSSQKGKTLGEVLPKGWESRVDRLLPDLAAFITDSLSKYLETSEGKEAVTSQLNHMFEGKGFFGNMLGLFLGNQSIIDKLYPELISFLSQPAFAETIETLLKKEWDRWLSLSFEEVTNKLELESAGKDWLIQSIVKHVPIREGFKLKPRDVLREYEPVLIDAIPKGVHILLEKLARKVPEILQTLDLESVVAEQVRHFSIQELEDVVLMISKKEFKMITYLGALLGGLIGIVQAVIVISMG